MTVWVCFATAKNINKNNRYNDKLFVFFVLFYISSTTRLFNTHVHCIYFANFNLYVQSIVFL